MKRMIVDKNMLEDPKNLGPKQPLRAWLAESKDHIAVVTDYAQLEMLKGNALKNILKSTEILAEFPNQVHILKPITTVSGLKGKKNALKKRVTSGGGTRSFRKWYAARARAAAGDARFAAKIVKRGEQATLQLAHMLADMTGFADNIRDATAAFTDEELGILRRHDPATESIVIKILDGTMRLALKFFLLHPNGKIPPAAHDLPDSFIFRFALCAFLHALHWRVRGGAEDRLAERMRNDVIDVTYAAYAVCFDGLLSEDKLVREIYDNAEVMLALFTNHAPKPPHRRSNTVGANASAAAPGPAQSR